MEEKEEVKKGPLSIFNLSPFRGSGTGELRMTGFDMRSKF